jgi:hypothetical protein
MTSLPNCEAKGEFMKIDKMIRAGCAGLALVLILMSAPFLAKAQDGFSSGAAAATIRSYYDSGGEWAGAFHMASISEMRPIPLGGGRWVVHVRYNFAGYGVDHSGANRSGETGWDARTFNLESSGGGYIVTGMGGHMSANMNAVAPAQVGTNTNAGDQLESAKHHGTEAMKKLPKNPEGELEPASAEARKPFDDHGDAAGHLDAVHTSSAGNPLRDPVVPKEYLNDSVVTKAMNDRGVAKKEWEKAEAELKTLDKSNPRDQVKIVALREKSDAAKNKVIYDNFSIGDRVKALSKGTKSQ